jgi:hypothetical protein
MSSDQDGKILLCRIYLKMVFEGHKICLSSFLLENFSC